MIDLTGQTVLIVGSTGIGGETAKLAAQFGAQVFVVSRHENNCAALAQEIRDSGGIAQHFAADQTDEAQVEAAVENCRETFGRIDALYNVAGISGRKFGDGPLHEASADGWDVTLDTNVKGMFFFCRAVLNVMLKQDVGPNGLRGTILNMASVLGFAPQRDFFATHAYAASKGAIIGLSRSMASYYAPHLIRVNVIAPSLIRTPMSARAQENPQILELMKTKQPLVGDMIDAIDVARASLFLLSDASRVITGDTLVVDGGWSVS